MTRVPGIGTIAPLVALAIVLPLWLVTSAALSLARQEDDVAPIEVGAGPIREQSLGFMGRNVYSGESVELFGYLTAVIGLERNLLFTAADAPRPRSRPPASPTRAASPSRPATTAPMSPPPVATASCASICRRMMPPARPGMIPVRLPVASRSPSIRSASSIRCSGRRPCRRPRRRRTAEPGNGRGVLTRWPALPFRGGRHRAAPALRRLPARRMPRRACSPSASPDRPV